MEKIGVIGASSPLGLALVSELVHHGYDVVVGVRNLHSIPRSWHKNYHVSCVYMDALKCRSLVQPFSECSVIIWLSHIRCEDSDKEIEHNVSSLKTFCEQIQDIDVSKIIFISSGGSVYGEPNILPIPEDHHRAPLSSYGIAKKMMEDLLLDYADQLNIRVGIIRPGNIYGPESLTGRAKGVIGSLFHSFTHKTRFTLIEGGCAVRDYVHVDDVSRAIIHAIACDNEIVIWNVGTGIGYSVRGIIDKFYRLVGEDSLIIDSRPARQGDVSSNVLSIKRIQCEAGWNPQISLEDGLSNLASLHRETTEYEVELVPSLMDKM